MKITYSVKHISIYHLIKKINGSSIILLSSSNQDILDHICFMLNEYEPYTEFDAVQTFCKFSSDKSLYYILNGYVD